MTGKYKSRLHFIIALAYRTIVRLVLSTAVSWDRKERPLQEGCTVIIGMCSRLPGILHGNLRGLRQAVWPGIREVIIVVDNLQGSLPASFEEETRKDFPDLDLRFIYYTPYQSRIAEHFKLPYIYSWLSWVVAIRACRTKTFFIHDYDAVLLGDFLKDRYQQFMQGQTAIQGIFYYRANGISPQDQLVCTFEAFVDTAWARSKAPIEIFNRLGFIGDVSVDFDTFLFMQYHHTKDGQRAIIPMSEEELLHPAQMIHQYTVFRKFPGRPWNCAGLVMIPFFLSLKEQAALGRAAQRIRSASTTTIELLADGCRMNFSTLQALDLDKMLRLMVQGYIKFDIQPFEDFYLYGEAFYDLIGLDQDQRWNISQTKAQQQWVDGLLPQVILKP